jgi:DNA-binding NtrC family response regulator
MMIAARCDTGEHMQEPKTILLVDDEMDIRELYKLVLESAGFTVIAVPNATAAFERLAAQPVDLVITDYQMPEMKGDRLIGIIREQYPGLPTILASGATDVEVVAKACGADACYRKGTSHSQMLNMITERLTACADDS